MLKVNTLEDVNERLRAENERLKQSYSALDDYFQKTRKRCEDLEAALKESTLAMEWHFDKSTPANPADHSDFFNITANAITKNNELLSQ